MLLELELELDLEMRKTLDETLEEVYRVDDLKLEVLCVPHGEVKVVQVDYYNMVVKFIRKNKIIFIQIIKDDNYKMTTDDKTILIKGHEELKETLKNI